MNRKLYSCCQHCGSDGCADDHTTPCPNGCNKDEETQ